MEKTNPLIMKDGMIMEPCEADRSFAPSGPLFKESSLPRELKELDKFLQSSQTSMR